MCCVCIFVVNMNVKQKRPVRVNGLKLHYMTTKRTPRSVHVRQAYRCALQVSPIHHHDNKVYQQNWSHKSEFYHSKTTLVLRENGKLSIVRISRADLILFILLKMKVNVLYGQHISLLYIVFPHCRCRGR